MNENQREMIAKQLGFSSDHYYSSSQKLARSMTCAGGAKFAFVK